MYQRPPATGFTNELGYIATKPYAGKRKTIYRINQKVSSVLVTKTGDARSLGFD